MNNTTKIKILAYASEPDKTIIITETLLSMKEKDILLVWQRSVSNL